MDIGREPWKWGVVFLLLAVFVAVANQAYVVVSSHETHPPPEDWKMGDSFDQEHKSGPGAGIPMSIPEDLPPEQASDPDVGASPDEPPLNQEPTDWSTVPNPGSAE